MSKPETVFKIGAVRAAILRNVLEKAGKQIPLPKVILEVRYRDKAGQWKGTNSLSLNEIPKAILALQKAYNYLMTHREPGAGGEDKGKNNGTQDWRDAFKAQGLKGTGT